MEFDLYAFLKYTNSLISKLKPQFLSFNETFLKPNQIFEIEGYNIFRADRVIQRGGGALLGVQNNLLGEQIDFTNLCYNDYATGFLVKATNNIKIAIITIYSPPKIPINQALFDYICRTFKHFFITGDLNAKSKSWFCKKDNPKGIWLERFANERNIHIVNNRKPTYIRSKSIIDLTICSNSTFKHFEKFRVLNNKISDHQPTISSFTKLNIKKTKVTLNKIKFELFHNIMDSSNLNFSQLNNQEDIELAANSINDQITKALLFSTQKIEINSVSNYFTQIPPFILGQIKQKRKLTRLLKQNYSHHVKKIINMLNRKIKTNLNKFKQAQIESKFSELSKFNQSSQKHWRIIKKIQNKAQDNNTKKKNKILIDPPPADNETYEQAIANEFAKNLSLTFSYTTNINIPTRRDQTTPVVQPSIDSETDTIISSEELCEPMHKWNSNSATGPDKINNKILKALPASTLTAIHNLFQATLKHSYIPKAWKSSKIIMILKKDKPAENVSSYRPISLINCISKWLEKIINTKLQNWVENNNILPHCQAGFRKNKSCQDQIFRLSQHITNGFNKKHLTGAIFFDLEKAFDKASHEGIIYRLKQHNLSNCLINWIKNFLLDRTYYVEYNGSKSNKYPIKSGVPQGSCISPTLFNIFFSQISESIPPNIKSALFADDLCIWFSDKSKKIIQTQLQQATNQIKLFCNTWGLSLNKSKKYYTIFTTAGYRKSYERLYKINLHLDNHKIQLDPHPTFLGIKLDPKLSFKAYLDSSETKITAKINLMKTIKGMNINSININKILYKSLIRSIFDYMAIILSTKNPK